MSDREGSHDSRESGAASPSPSRSYSASQKSAKSEAGSVHSERAPSKSRSRSRSPRPKSYSRSRSRSRDRSKRYRTRSRSRSRGKRYYSRSRSRSYGRDRRRRYRSRSRSYSPYERRGSRYDRRGYYRSHSRSPMSRRRRHMGSRDNPEQSRCLGVFGLSLYTQDRDLKEVFGRFGPLDEVNVVYDHQTGRSRGFAFVYFKNSSDAAEAKERCTGIEVDGRRIRVDFSITERAHTPTPGIYLGKPTSRRRSPSPYYRRGGRSRYSRSRSRSRSYSPRRY